MATDQKFGTKIEGGWFDDRVNEQTGRELHLYRDEAGVIVPSSTQVIAMAGFSDFSRVKPEVLDRKRKIGSAVHRATEFIDQPRHGELDWSSVHEACVGYVIAYEHAVEELDLIPTVVERAMVVTIHGMKYGVRLDRAGTTGKMHLPMIWELKCGVKDSIAWALQTASQELAIGPSPKGKWERAALQLRKDGTFKVFPYKDKNELNWFLCCLALAHLKLREGLVLPEIPEDTFGEEEEYGE